MVSTVLLVLCGAITAPGSFLLPDELLEAQGVQLKAQRPEPGMQLIAKDETRPKLWYAPVATRVMEDGVRVWYQRVNSGESEWLDQRTLCVGDIRGGDFLLPALRDTEPVWGGPNNVCMTRSPHTPTWGGFNVFQIVEQDGALQMLYWDQPDEDGQAGVMLATSDDGWQWDKRPGTVFTEHNDAYTVRPHGEAYLLYQTVLEDWPDKPFADNLDGKRRVQSLRRSTDLKTWTPQEVILRPDDQDPPEAEFYLMKTFPYGAGYAGLLMKYYADPKLEGKHSGIIVNELIASRDGVQWERPYRDTDIGFWAYADPFDIGNKTHFVIWKDGGMETVYYSKNRLTGVTSEGDGGFSLALGANRELPGRLNADTSDGWIELDVIDGNGVVQAGYGQCRIEKVDGSSIPLGWKIGKAAPDMRLRVRMNAATIFALE